jgi:hypothetical protein
VSSANRSAEEYVRRYANDYCNGDIDDAMKHIIVKAVIEEKEKEDVNNIR